MSAGHGTHRQTASRLAGLVAAAIADGFDTYRHEFRLVTLRARAHFEHRDWAGAQADATRRLELYGGVLAGLLPRIRGLLGDRLTDRIVWAGAKAVYSSRISDHPDWELAETFFNSVTRRVFTTVGVDPDIEFVETDSASPPAAAATPVHRGYRVGAGDRLDAVIRSILDRSELSAGFADADTDAAAVAERLEGDLGGPVARIEVLDALFFRRKGAYVVGQCWVGGKRHPLVLALAATEDGAVVDAVLTSEDDVSGLFSFTRSHLHVALEPAHAVVRFLGTLMPRKRVAELYIAIGHHKHGKTELYRGLRHDLDVSSEDFDLAPGTPGLVMVVFTVPGSDLVLKVIRDRLPAQKRTSRADVMRKYRLVFLRDRAGRLVEAHEFEHLELPRERVSARLLEELLDQAGRTVRVDGDQVHLEHAYLERRVEPLDVHLRRCDGATSEATVRDYGRAIKDLAATGVFPGDLLLKNFGVTRHGRVVFYDYDEIALIGDLRFRELPAPRSPEEELAGEPMHGVDPGDVFPEELRRFLGLGGSLRATFDAEHGDVFAPAFWRAMQQRLRAGEVIDLVPYPDDRRLVARPPR